MNLRMPIRHLKLFAGNEVFDDIIGFRNDQQTVDVSADLFTKEQLDQLYVEAKKIDESWARGLMIRISSYRNIHDKPDGIIIKKLENLAEALKVYLRQSEHQWVFFDQADGYAVPYYVESIRYESGTRFDSTPRVIMSLAAISRGVADDDTVIFRADTLGKTVVEVLQSKNYYRETPAAVDSYLADVEIYKKWSGMTGSQYSCTGTGFLFDHGSYYDDCAMEREGEPATVVMDDVDTSEASEASSEEKNQATCSSKFWSTQKDSTDEDDVFVVKPVHPYVKVFDLRLHAFVLVHVRNLKPYIYDKGAVDKLVLAKDMKVLIDLLVHGASEVLEDIVRGKTGGTIVISTGPPGVGKTLTAEVYAEAIGRPLYVVQCAQLGTNEEKLEKQLQLVLARSSRWRAILLLDEADVYVHSRGNDIRQNAIVGVFLRVLEHYRGILFLTSNRETVIDDAILSRATAWLRYAMPTASELRELWHVLSTQYKMPLGKPTVAKLVTKFPRLSGRNIKNMLKLATRLLRSQNGRKPDVDVFVEVSKFLDIQTGNRPS